MDVLDRDRKQQNDVGTIILLFLLIIGLVGIMIFSIQEHSTDFEEFERTRITAPTYPIMNDTGGAYVQ